MKEPIPSTQVPPFYREFLLSQDQVFLNKDCHFRRELVHIHRCWFHSCFRCSQMDTDRRKRLFHLYNFHHVDKDLKSTNLITKSYQRIMNYKKTYKFVSMLVVLGIDCNLNSPFIEVKPQIKMLR